MGTFTSDTTAVEWAVPFISSPTRVPAAPHQKPRAVVENALILQQGMMGGKKKTEDLERI